MDESTTLKKVINEWHGSLKAYLIGFVLSLIFTLISYSLVLGNLAHGDQLSHSLIAFAILQALTQILFFLHLGREVSPYWETNMFLFMLLVLGIVVGGTLWIMSDLDERVMSEMMNAMRM